ncbi:MAG: hypothetical protein K2X86_00525 [Cytophagaceae bacterium]|nr:hypothetical protein [Cytophagaceae bacterium]
MSIILFHLGFLSLLILSPACKMHPVSSNSFDSSVIIMEKTECYGYCPVYSITIDGTGKVIYEGKKHVKKVGKFERQLSGKEISTIFSAFEHSDFFKLQNEYTAGVSDMPTVYVTFEHQGQKKKITDYYGAPESLKKLEELVEKVALSEEGWKQL